MLTAWRRLGDYDHTRPFGPWLRGIATRLVLRHRDRRFEDVSSHAGAVFEKAWAGRGAALGDLDNDGAVDIVVSNLDGAPYLARNRAEGGNWVGFKLRGCASNRDAIGARVALTRVDGSRQFRTVSRAGSYLSSHDPRVFFGLGEAGRFGSVEIRWPSGVTQKLDGAAGGRIVAVEEPSDDSECR